MTTEICYECKGTGESEPAFWCHVCDGTGHIQIAADIATVERQSPGLDAFDKWCDDLLDKERDYQFKGGE